jgi:CHAT domain-containing protein/Tfp pilus assembly protein PilF
MSWGRIPLGLALAGAVLGYSASAQNTSDPEKLLEQAERLAWLKAWTRAEPLYDQAARLFTARGDRRNALYAEINRLRGELPRLAIPEVSQRLAEYLDDPVVQGDDRLHLRCLTIKGETDVDLDPSLSERSWREALALAEKLGDAGWANRAKGELGLVAFLQGDINNSVIRLGQALKIAETNGDIASLVRWLTLFGHGYAELGRPEQALDFYNRALKAAIMIPELQFPVMTYLGKGDALVRLGRFNDADQLLKDALAFATREGALGYQAELTYKQGLVASERKQAEQAIELLTRAIDLGRQAGGNRIVAEVSLDLARMQRAAGKPEEAERTLRQGVQMAREMAEHLLLPRLLAQLADLKASQRRYAEATDLLEEANDMLEGLLTNASSPWVRSRVIGGMSDVYLERVRVEASRGQGPAGVFAVVEQAHGRSLLELLLSTALSDVKKPQELRAAERRIASLQVKLLWTTNRSERQRLLDQIFVAEEHLAPVETELFNRSRAVPRKSLTLQDVQRALRADELLLEFALAEPDSYGLVVTRNNARLRQLPSRSAIEKRVELLMGAVRDGNNSEGEARAISELLLDRIPELATRTRVIVSADGALHQLPFELLTDASGRRLLESHVVSYVPSGSILAVLRRRPTGQAGERAALAIAASTESDQGRAPNGASVIGGIERGVYDLDASKLPPLPAANDEARVVAAALGQSRSTVLAGDSASELELKRLPLNHYRVLHFAVHGIMSTKFPARSALLLRPSGVEDGLLQAREILMMRLAAELVTLAACDTGTGTLHGQEGVSSLVRPFLAAGARTVVANLWSADDQFSLGLMREFYRQLAAGADIGAALRSSKLKMIERFGSDAVPKLWSGVLVYGDGANVVTRGATASN